MFAKGYAAIVALSVAAIGTQAASEFVLDEAYQPAITRPAVQFSSSSDAAGNSAVHGIVHAINGRPALRLAKMQSDGSMDQTFRPVASPLCEQYGFSVLLMDDRKVVAAGCDYGIFDLPFSARRFRDDGTPDPTFIPARRYEPAGRLFRGPTAGVFWSISGLVLLRDDGSADPNFAPQWGIDAYDLAMSQDGKVFVAGYIAEIDQTNGVEFGVARLMANGTFDPTFVARPVNSNLFYGLPVAVGATPDGGALASYPIYPFSNDGLGPLVRYRSDGSEDESFALDQDGGVFAIKVLPDGRIIIAGNFTRVNGLPRLRIARLHPDGTLDTSFEPDAAADEEPVQIGGPYSTELSDPFEGPVSVLTNSLPDPLNRITVQADGKILARGNSDRGDWLMRFNEDGHLDRSFSPTVEMAGQVRHLLIQRDGRCVIWDWSLVDAVRPVAVPDPLAPSGFAPVPTWQFINGQTRPALARLNADGTLDTAFATTFPPTQGALIRGAVEAADTSVLLWGRYSNVAGLTRTDVLRVAPDGQVDTALQATTEPAGSVLGVLTQPNGSLVIWGSFSNVNSHPISGVARLLANGAVDQSFSPVSSGTVSGLSENPPGNLLLFGLFTTANNATTTRLAQVTSNGELGSGIQPTANGAVEGVLPAADGGSYLWGGFSQVNGTPRARLAKLAADGSLDVTFNAGPGPDLPPRGIRELSDGKLVVWGDFRRFSGVSRRKMVRLLASGALDLSAQALALGIGIRDVLPDRQGGTIVFPDTSNLSSTPAESNHFHTAFYLRADGTLALLLPTMTNDEPRDWPYITQAAWDSQGRLVVAGKFAGVDGRQRFALARYLRAPRLENAAYSSTLGFRATVLGRTGQMFRLERSTNLLDWTPVGMFTTTGPETVVEDSGAAGTAAQFYRIVSTTQ